MDILPGLCLWHHHLLLAIEQVTSPVNLIEKKSYIPVENRTHDPLIFSQTPYPLDQVLFTFKAWKIIYLTQICEIMQLSSYKSCLFSKLKYSCFQIDMVLFEYSFLYINVQINSSKSYEYCHGFLLIIPGQECFTKSNIESYQQFYQ